MNSKNLVPYKRTLVFVTYPIPTLTTFFYFFNYSTSTEYEISS